MNKYEYKLVQEESPQVNEQPILLKSSFDVYEFLKNNVYTDGTIGIYESSYVIYLNNRMEVKGYMLISRGGLTHTSVDPRMIFAGALMVLATNIIFTHNHPSGINRPSEEDNELTKTIQLCGNLLDIKLTDHVIVTNKTYYSYCEHGQLLQK